MLLLLACTPPETPPGTTSGDSPIAESRADSDSPTDSPIDTAPVDTGPDWTQRFELGDAILATGRGGQGNAGPGVPVEEWLDAVVLSETRAFIVGEGGMRLVDLDTADVLWEDTNRRTYESALDGDLVVLGNRTSTLQVVDVSDHERIRITQFIELPDSYHEELAFDDGRILVGYQELGGLMLDTAGNELGTLPADNAFAVGLVGDRAVLTDDEELVLFDVTDPASPLELDRVTMSGEGRGLDFDGTELVVALGGKGVTVYRVEEDAFVHRGDLEVPGVVTDVALDGETAWIAAWEVTALAWIGDGGPVILTHETPTSSAMAVAAGHGKAIVGDWHYIATMARVDGVAGPELVIDEGVNVRPAEDVVVELSNGGPFPLTFAFDAPPDGVTLDTSELVLAPGERGTRVATLPDELTDAMELTWTSDDPDETAGTFVLTPRDDREGSEHPDFTLNGFVHPDPTPQTFSLAEQRGKVVVLAYFATF